MYSFLIPSSPPFRSFCMFGKCSRVCSSSSPFPLQKKLASVGGKRKVGKMEVRGSFLFPLLFLKIVFLLPLLSGCLLLRSVYSRPPSLRNDWASVIRGQGLFLQFLVLTESRGISAPAKAPKANKITGNSPTHAHLWLQ